MQQKQYKVKSPIVTRRLIIVFTALLLAVILCGGYFAYRTVYDRYLAPQPDEFSQSDGKTGNVLVVSGEEDKLRITLLHYDTSDGTVSVASLPRNLTVTYNEMNKTLTGYYKYGGILYLKQVMTDAMSLKIDRYLYMPNEALEGIVDTVGGVEFNIESEMHETDENGIEITGLQSGLQTLGGQQVLGYYRYSKWKDRNEFLQKRNAMTCALIEKIASESVAPNFEAIYKKHVNMFDTDINAQAIAAFAAESESFVLSDPTAIDVIVELSQGQTVTLTEVGADALLTTFGSATAK